jgi:MFS family permease
MDDKVSPKRTFVPSLMLCYFSTYLLDFLVGLLLLDVTLTFFGSSDKIFVAITSQIATVSSIAAVITGILIASLSVRVDRRLILLIGAICIPIGVLGCALAENFLTLEIFFPFDGVGSIIVGSMVFAIAGETLPISKRARALGWIVSGATWAQFFGALLIRYFFPAGNWQAFLLWYAFPVSIFAVIFAFFSLKSAALTKQKSNLERLPIYIGFKEVFKNRSATSCLVGNMIRHAGMIWGTVFSATFFRLKFDIPLPTYALVALFGTILFALGNIGGGQIVEKVGRKRLVLLCFALAGTFTIFAVFIPIVWLAIAFGLAGNVVGGMGSAGTLNMTVEQVPKYRGTIMSMSTVFVTLGAAIGTAVGGAVLAISGNYQILALTFVSFTFLAGGIYLFTKDPCRS